MKLQLGFIIASLLVLLASNSIITQAAFPDNTGVKKVTIGDIDVGYKMLGKGEPLLLIPGFSMTMDMWDPLMIEKLSTNRTVILFDNRGMGSTVGTYNNNNYSIEQLANDTAALVDRLKI